MLNSKYHRSQGEYFDCRKLDFVDIFKGPPTRGKRDGVIGHILTLFCQGGQFCPTPKIYSKILAKVTKKIF